VANIPQSGSALDPVNRTPPVPEIQIPSFRAAGADPATWIKAGEKPVTFRVSGQRRDITMVPLYTLFDRRYSVYWRVA
jgi:hypothetical protein